MSDAVIICLITNSVTIFVVFLSRYLSHREHKDGTTITADTNKRARRIEKAMNGRIEKD
jgi:hypothetical protein